ncbi:MAG: dicarboxylate/amino acid:cation symporter [Clostridia bacterium]|nr:dicarboxylate/amino acid:cation symporter [Clostridia bacterium]
MSEQKKKSSYRYPIILLVSVIAGGVLGAILGEKATVVEPIGKLFINMLFTLITPLVFFSIASAISVFKNLKRLGKMLGSVIGVFVGTGAIASIFMLILIQFIQYGKGISIVPSEVAEASALSIGDHIVNMFTVSDFPNLLSRTRMMPLIVFAILFGVATALLGEKGEKVHEGLENISNVIFKMINMLMKVAPIGLAAYFANLTGIYGPKLLGTYARAMALFYPTLFVYFFVFFSLYAFWAAGKNGVKAYFKNIFTPAVNAIGTRSSAANIPINLEACDRIGIPQDVSSVVLPMGATMHMDGSCLSCIFKIVVLSSIFGVPFEGLGTYAFAIFVAVFSATAISAVPGGGAVGEAMIVTMFGFPPEALPIVILLGQLCDPITTMVNSTGDTVASMMVTRLLEGKDWLSRNLSGQQNKNW